jgi:hypothetical protein
MANQRPVIPLSTRPHNEHYAIYNLDAEGQPGSHWVSIVFSNNTAMLYDSFGRYLSRGYARTLNKTLKPYQVIETDHDPEQIASESDCGQNSVAWLMTYHQFGWDGAKLV